MLERSASLPERLCEARSATLAGIREGLHPLDRVTKAIASALSDDPPLSLADGGVIRSGYNTELDALRGIRVNGKAWIANLQTKERERTGISSLKVGFNNVFGYYLEVTNTHREKVPDYFTRKQTLANAERFITPELKEYEEKILTAEEKILALESELFAGLLGTIDEHAAEIQANAGLIATLDCFASLAGVAEENSYVLPEVSGENRIEITGGRHPVIERLLPPGEAYTPNDIALENTGNQVLIITGPNMSGKSSYLRQAGLIVLLAHIGSFVPAKAARIGLVDRIFTRVGASDNIASGESTFLVEMHEAANILNTATPKSLILLDEVGRGTSTFDGISIAWALTEYIHDRIGAKTLFATHYHELNELASLFPRVRNMKVEVREYGDKVIFLHKVTPGYADHSYGIQVAQMAGLPEEVTERAKQILKNLEGSGLSVHDEPLAARGRSARGEMQMTLFEMKDDKLREALKGLDIEKMTPLEALQKLAEMKKMTD
jgi:DNA mismatch repair protein MutS